MKQVKLRMHIRDRDPDDVYLALCDFGAYPDLCSAVRSIRVESTSLDEAISSWEVNFQTGILKWTERDCFYRDRREIAFQQIAGDIDHFSGCWRVLAHAEGTMITFDAQFDLGIPMLADMLDPVAKKAIEDNIDSIIRGLFLSVRAEAA